MSLLGTGVGIDPPRLRFSRGGGDREGPVAPLSWGPRAPSWESGRIALLTPLDSPARSLEIESRGRVLPFWGRGGDVCRPWGCRNRSATISVFEGGGDREGPVAHLSGAVVHRPGEKGAVGPSHASRLARSLPRKRKSRQSAAVLGPRCGRVTLTGTSDGIAQ